MIVGAIGGYVAQVAENMQQGMDFSQALTTNVSADKIISGAVIGGGFAVTGTAIHTAVGLITAATTATAAACSDDGCATEVQQASEVVDNVTNKIGSTGQIGEKYLQDNFGGVSQKYFPKNLGKRYVDIYANRIAMESKVGYVPLTNSSKMQVLKDYFLLQNNRVQGVEWYFFKSPVTGKIGPSGPLLNFLNDHNITTHMIQ
ncbi:MAG TPA: hypothetical protein DD636_03465 [Anaerolineaceae bacterium]|nr:hypothetical protein [Anaerolineaceae bacterium]